MSAPRDLWIDQGDGTSLRADQRPGRPSAIADGYTADVLNTPVRGRVTIHVPNGAPGATDPVQVTAPEIAALRDEPYVSRQRDRQVEGIVQAYAKAASAAAGQAIPSAEPEPETGTGARVASLADHPRFAEARAGAEASAAAAADGPETELEAGI
jgi:hypothetical protein